MRLSSLAAPLAYSAIPVAFLVRSLAGGKSWEPPVTFLLAAIGTLPLASLMGKATEHLSERAGPTWGGLLNATFGNAAELIIAIIALSRGLNDMVMASLTGSILGNLLLVSGAAMLVGGWRRENQQFSRSTVETNGGLLALAVASVMLPTLFHHFYTPDAAAGQPLLRSQMKGFEHHISLAVSVILLLVYGLGLLFTLRTHSHLFTLCPPATPEDPPGVAALHGGHAAWPVRKSVLMLLLASVGVGIVAEVLVGSADLMAKAFGWNEIFIGVILLAIIGNAAEHSTALLLARANDMDTAQAITYQSSTQIALFVTPALVLVSGLFVAFGITARPLNLVFSEMEVSAVLLTVAIVVLLGLDGKTNWFEGVLLLALYAVLAVTFFYIPAHKPEPLELHAPSPAARTSVIQYPPGYQPGRSVAISV